MSRRFTAALFASIFLVLAGPAVAPALADDDLTHNGPAPTSIQMTYN